MKSVIFLPVVLECAAACAVAQDSAYLAAFITLLGTDTLAVERFVRVPDGREATVVLRTPQTTVQHYRLGLDDFGNLTRYEAVINVPGSPAGTPPLRQEVYVPAGDSLEVTLTEEGRTETRRIPWTPKALPFIDMVHWPFELMLVQARASGLDSLSQPLFTARNPINFVIRKAGDGRMTVTHPFRGSMDVTVDGEGRLLKLDAGATTRALVVNRVEEADVEAIAERFAAQDAAGRSFGPLSGRAGTTRQVDGATITIDYGQPAKRGRTIFGDLVPWGKLWRAGANRATHLETDHALVMGDLVVPASQYTLFIIPEPEGGYLVINKQTGQNGNAYDPQYDLGRVPLSISSLVDPVELFTIEILETELGGELHFKWDLIEFGVAFRVID